MSPRLAGLLTLFFLMAPDRQQGWKKNGRPRGAPGIRYLGLLQGATNRSGFRFYLSYWSPPLPTFPPLVMQAIPYAKSS